MQGHILAISCFDASRINCAKAPGALSLNERRYEQCQRFVCTEQRHAIFPPAATVQTYLGENPTPALLYSLTVSHTHPFDPMFVGSMADSTYRTLRFIS